MFTKGYSSVTENIASYSPFFYFLLSLQKSNLKKYSLSPLYSPSPNYPSIATFPSLYQPLSTLLPKLPIPQPPSLSFPSINHSPSLLLLNKTLPSGFGKFCVSKIKLTGLSSFPSGNLNSKFFNKNTIIALISAEAKNLPGHACRP